MKKTMQGRPRHRQGGFSLIEMTIAVAVSVAASAGLYGVFKEQQRENVIQAESQNYAAMLDSVKSRYRRIPSMAAVNDSALINSGVVPAGRIEAGTKIMSLWGTQIKATGVGVDEIEMAYSVPLRSCVEFVKENFQLTSFVWVGGAQVRNAADANQAKFKVDLVASKCSALGGTHVEVKLRAVVK